MASKKLRSLLLESLPLELRVQIDLLSRRRDIANKEKQSELFKLLRSFNIENVTPLGPGTNRYAFKLNGYVIKVATDNDGKIDNFKEFKMAKRLFPYTTKVYEVSSNGTLLVAEYIQPFQSYTEMLHYADKIRDILKKLSNVYLIGDVGITAKNYANWGIRIGTDEPVCLDFAYVYDVSSELFTCTRCGSMLTPNKDFTELYCPNPSCGHKYLFEDIRRRIGNDLHKHEIGDLTEEGYLLYESKVDTELTASRSNYLDRKKKHKKPNKPDNEVIEEDTSFIYDENDEKKEETNMKNNYIEAIAMNMKDEDFVVNGTVIPAEVVSVDTEDSEDIFDEEDLYDDDEDYEYYDDEDEDYEYDDEDEFGKIAETALHQVKEIGFHQMKEMGFGSYNIPETGGKDLAFSGSVEDDDGEVVEEVKEPVFSSEVKTVTPQEDVPLEEIDMTTAEALEAYEVPNHSNRSVYLEPESTTIRNGSADKEEEIDDFIFEDDLEPHTISTDPAPDVQIVEEGKGQDGEESPTSDVEQDDPFSKFVNFINPDRFINQAHRAISKFANFIADVSYADQLFDQISNRIDQKRYFIGDFKNTMSNVMFRSLAQFLNLEEHDVPNKNGSGTHKEWVMKPEGITEENYPTVLFIYRYWITRDLNTATSVAEFVSAYNAHFQNGNEAYLQDEFFEVFRNRLRTKLRGTNSAYAIIIDYLKKLNPEVKAENEDPEILPPDPTPGPTAPNNEGSAASPSPETGATNDPEVKDNKELDSETSNQVESSVEEIGEAINDPDDANEMSTEELVDEIFKDANNINQISLEEDHIHGSIDGDEVDDDEDNYDIPIYVTVHHDEYGDVIKVKYEDEYGENVIPLYVSKTAYESAKNAHPITLHKWDWLRNTVPDMVFKTKNYLEFAKLSNARDNDDVENLTKFVRIADDGDDAIIGVYDFAGFYEVDDDGQMTMITEENYTNLICTILNNLFDSGSFGNLISYASRTLQMKEKFVEEQPLKEYIEEVFGEEFFNDEDEADDISDDIAEIASLPSKERMEVSTRKAADHYNAIPHQHREESPQTFTPVRRGTV